jgi:hypothetical protein
MGGFIFLAVFVAIAYFVWPDGVTAQTLSQMTFGSLLRCIGSGVIVIWGIGGAITFFWDA